MPAEIQKAVDYTLIDLRTTNCFLGVILIGNKRPEEEHKQCCKLCLKRLDEENHSTNLPKCHFVKL